MKKTTTVMYTTIFLAGIYVFVVYFISVWFHHPEALPFPVEEIEAGSLMGVVDSFFACGLLTGSALIAIGVLGLRAEYKSWQFAKQRAKQKELYRAQRRAERRARRTNGSR